MTAPTPEEVTGLVKLLNSVGNGEMAHIPTVVKTCLKAAAALESIAKERDRLLDDLRYVERVACHHAIKPHNTPEAMLSLIQWYPPIRDITRSYVDGITPSTPDPYAQHRATIERLEGELAEQVQVTARIASERACLEVALRKYGQHPGHCRYYDGKDCTCGLDAALAPGGSSNE